MIYHGNTEIVGEMVIKISLGYLGDHKLDPIKWNEWQLQTEIPVHLVLWKLNILGSSYGDSGSTVIKVLYYKSEVRWFDPSWCQYIFHWHKVLPIALLLWGRLSL